MLRRTGGIGGGVCVGEHDVGFEARCVAACGTAAGNGCEEVALLAGGGAA